MADWFVVNVRDARWRRHETFGASCRFETPQTPFDQLGVNIRVLQPGEPNCLYHSENLQEDFLVLAGECLLLVDGEERPLQAWDFVHCPPGTEHVFVGAGDGALRDPHGRRAERRRAAALPRVRGRAPTRGERRAGNGVGGGGLRAVRAAAEGSAAGRMGRAALGLTVRY
jgi:uncharacterized cupin superfamily protein